MAEHRLDNPLLEGEAIDEANRLVREGELLLAYDLLLALRKSANIVRLLETLAGHLLTEYRARLLGRPYYPQRHAVLGDIRRYYLTAKDVYVLGLYDGQTNVADVVAISPVDELATLRSTAKLIDLALLAAPSLRQ